MLPTISKVSKSVRWLMYAWMKALPNSQCIYIHFVHFKENKINVVSIPFYGHASRQISNGDTFYTFTFTFYSSRRTISIFKQTIYQTNEFQFLRSFFEVSLVKEGEREIAVNKSSFTKYLYLTQSKMYNLPIIFNEQKFQLKLNMFNEVEYKMISFVLFLYVCN